MIDRFELQSADKAEVKQLLGKALGREQLSDSQLRLVIACLAANSKQQDIVLVPDDPQSTGFNMRPGGGAYHINVENTLLLAAAILLDAIASAGVASALLAASGRKLQSISKLSLASGELCNYISLESIERNGFPIDAKQVHQLTYGSLCRHPQFDCNHNVGGICHISIEVIQGNLGTLKEKAIVQINLQGDIDKVV